MHLSQETYDATTQSTAYKEGHGRLSDALVGEEFGSGIPDKVTNPTEGVKRNGKCRQAM